LQLKSLAKFRVCLDSELLQRGRLQRGGTGINKSDRTEIYTLLLNHFVFYNFKKKIL